jgi:Usher syndrome type-1G protein
MHLKKNFRHSVTSALSAMDQTSNHSSSESGSVQQQQSQTLKKSSARHRNQQLLLTDSEEESADSQNSSNEDEDDEGENSYKNLKRFLAAYSLEQHYDVLYQQQINLSDLMILTEEDLKTLSLPLGPYRRLVCAIEERKQALNNPGAILDSRL